MAQINHRLPDGKRRARKWSYRLIIKLLQQALLQPNSSKHHPPLQSKALDLFRLVNVHHLVFQMCHIFTSDLVFSGRLSHRCKLDKGAKEDQDEMLLFCSFIMKRGIWKCILLLLTLQWGEIKIWKRFESFLTLKCQTLAGRCFSNVRICWLSLFSTI